MANQTEGRGIVRRQRVRRTLLLVFLLVFPLTFNYYSPALPIQGTLERVACFSLIFWSAWALASLAFGRASCGYICPLGALQELWDYSAQRSLIRVKSLSVVKYAIFALWAGTIVFAAVRSGGWDRVDVLYRTENYVSWDKPQSAIIYLGMFGLMTLLRLPLGRRASCHYLCWWAPLNIMGTKLKERAALPSLRLVARSDGCAASHTCDRFCPMSLPVSAMVERQDMSSTECILCGSCVDNCRRGSVRYSWGRARSRRL